MVLVRNDVRRFSIRLFFALLSVQTLCFATTVATPTFSPAAGTYTSVQTVTISDSTSGATIYYTTDGSTPTTSSTHYTSPITVSSSETVKAIGTKTGDTQSAVGSAAYTINLTAATPTFSPVAGTYTGAQTVTISDSTSGATIYYTTNGSTPTTSSTQYTSPISVSVSETVKAIAKATGYSQSAVGSAAYTLTANTPTFSPVAGTYTGPQTVTISDSISGATIYYTTNGSTPTTSSTQYAGPIYVNASETVKAIAAATGYTNSAVGSAAYTLTANTPTFSPGAGSYSGTQTVTVSDSTPGASIYYTTNGSTPTTSSTLYTAPISVSASETIKAIAAVTGYSNSAVASAAYTITPQVATPTLSPASGSYSTVQSVTISDGTSGAAIYYTTDGSTPTTSSTRYTTAITINATTTINALATKSGDSNSAIGSATYTITTPADPTPTFSPGTGTFLYENSPSVSISDTDANTTIYYTTNGSTPTTSSTVYSGPVYISSTTTLKAIATDSGYLNSSVGSAVYTLQADPPYLWLNGGSYVGSQSLTLSDDTGRSSKIYYTTNGTTPTTSSTLYSSPLTISSTETVEAIATSNGFQTSPVSSATYTITSSAAPPTLSPSGGSYSDPQLVTISTTSQNATTYYTITAGSTGIAPTTLSTVYSGGVISVGATETIEATAVASGYPASVVTTGTYTLPTPAASNITLSLTSGGHSVTSVAAGSQLTLTATVSSGGAAVASGTVNFCNASVAYCTDVEIVGTAQLTSSGTATINLRPNIGTHIYKAVFAGSSSYQASTSSTSQLTVTGLYPTTTTVAASGSVDNYTLVGTVVGAGNGTIAPTGTVSFLDASNSNAVLAAAALSGSNSQFVISTGATYSTGNQPSDVAIGDLNGDGINDLAVLNAGDGTVTILLGNGDGTFTAATSSPFAAGNSPNAIAVGDFNGDGRTDLAITSFVESYIAVFLGNGDGTFTAAPNSPMTNFGSFSLAVGDFNNDGKVDLALPSYSNSSITIMLGNGDGTFTTGISSPAGISAFSVAAGDFNGNGQVDLVLWGGQNNFVSVLLNNGDGSFRLAPTTPITIGQSGNGYVTSVAVADINGDGQQDLVISNEYAETVSLLLGHGDGSFTPSAFSPLSGYYPGQASVGDFNGDGVADVAVASDGFTLFIWGAASGSSYFPLLTAVNGSLLGPVADFNSDGIPDWPELNSSANTVTIMPTELTMTATATATGVSPFGSGTHNVEASYAGDSNYAGSTSSTTPLTADTVSQAPAPAFTPTPGTYTSPQTVSISDSASGATIYYTTDGTTPTASSSVYTGPFAVTPTETVEAVATALGYAQSAVGIATYSLPAMAATPAFSPGPGTYASAQTVTISDATTGATIYYTADGSTPTSLSPQVSGPVAVGSSETFKAIAAASGYSQSGVGVANYVIGTPPAINSVAPLSGPVGTVLTITGTGFGSSQGSSTVTIGGIIAIPTTWTSTQIQAPIPSSAATGNQAILVTLSSLPSASSTITVTPSVSALTPNSGYPGTAVRIVGTNFGAYVPGISAVTFNGGSASISNWTPTMIEAVAPPATSNQVGGGPQTGGVTTGPVVVEAYNPTNNTTTASNGVMFTSLLAPTITGLNPSGGAIGSNITITGFNFGTLQSAGTVTFNGVSATPTTWGADTIIVPVPSGATTGPVVVSVGGVASNSYQFNVGATISGISPSAGNVSTSVTISGSGFGSSRGTSAVNFNGTPATPTSWSNGSIVVPVPVGATSGAVTVVVNGVPTNGVSFAVSPSIGSLSPTSGPVGTMVTISGSSFGAVQGGSTIAFGTTAASPIQWSPNKLVVPVPTGSVTSSVVVTVGGQASNGITFAVGNGAITGSVTNSSNGAGLSGAVVQALQSGVVITSTTSGGSGTYTIPSIAPGTYDLSVSEAGFGTAVVTSVSVTLPGPTTVNVPLGSAGSIGGTITQADGVTPIVGATVTVLSGQDTVGTSSTNSSGSYLVSNLAAAAYSLQIQASGYGIGNQSGVTVSAGNTTTVNLSLVGQPQITYTYDELGRLVGVTNSAGGSAAYAYDAVGNILSVSTVGAGQLSVLDFTPKSGPVGTSVTITGTAFNGNPLQDTVSVGGANATVSAATTSQLTITVPSGATNGPISVTTPAGSASSAASFTVTSASALPSITSFAPLMGNAGTGVTINGSNFAAPINDQLTFNGQNAPVYDATSTSVLAYVPANATSGPITFATPAGSTASSTDFFVIPASYSSGQVDFAGTMNIGGQFTGTINNSGDIGEVLFNATAGQSFGLTVTSSTVASGTVSVLSPSGSTLAQTSVGLGTTQVSSLPAPSTGTYTILFAAAAGSSGSLTLNLSSASQATITPGTLQTVTISSGQNAQLAFSGSAGQIATIQLANSTFPGGCYSLTVSVLNPDGSTLTSDNWCGQGNFFMNSTTLPTTGNYTLLITPQSGGTGSVEALVSLSQQQQGTFSPGVPTTMTVNVPGQTAAQTFTGTAGQMASILFNNCALSIVAPGSCDAGLFTVLNPDGTTLYSQTIAAASLSLPTPFTLPATGTYTLKFAPQNGAIGTAQATVWLFSEQIGSVAPGSPAPSTVTINSPQQYMQLTFSGNTGQSLSLNLTNSTFRFGSCNGFEECAVGVTVLNPDGSTLTSAQLAYSLIFPPSGAPTALSVGPISLPSTGTYTVTITPDTGVSGLLNQGSANFSLTVQ